jgi:hypothetical protein
VGGMYGHQIAVQQCRSSTQHLCSTFAMCSQRGADAFRPQRTTGRSDGPARTVGAGRGPAGVGTAETVVPPIRGGAPGPAPRPPPAVAGAPTRGGAGAAPEKTGGATTGTTGLARTARRAPEWCGPSRGRSPGAAPPSPAARAAPGSRARKPRLRR